jgi:hypothetical protein
MPSFFVARLSVCMLTFVMQLCVSMYMHACISACCFVLYILKPYLTCTCPKYKNNVVVHVSTVVCVVCHCHHVDLHGQRMENFMTL